MKQLTLVRHAKAEEGNFIYGLSDIERSLTKKGEIQARQAGNFLLKNDEKPNLILSSPAKRALQTAEFIADELSYNKRLITTDSVIYSGDENAILERICQIDNKIDHVLLCGHNPTILILANLLNETKRNHFKKSYVLGLSFKINHWFDLFEEQKGNEKFKFEPEV